MNKHEIKEPDLDERINELAEWYQGLTIDQAFFIKDCYEALLKEQASEVGNGLIH